MVHYDDRDHRVEPDVEAESNMHILYCEQITSEPRIR
jgi:hypothetical protein